ncbi:hypothetical protein ACTXT7_016766 [Hymenolepis weldensis]
MKQCEDRTRDTPNYNSKLPEREVVITARRTPCLPILLCPHMDHSSNTYILDRDRRKGYRIERLPQI